jgi:RND family efflux transporter MFP subunit
MRTFLARIHAFFSGIWLRFRNLSLKKKILIVCVILVGLLIASSVISSVNKKPDYTLAKAKRGNITEVVSETGSISTNGRTDVYSPTNGVVEEVLVANGDEVKKGQEMFKIKSSATEQEASQALAALMAARTTLDTANATLPSLQAAMFSSWDAYKTLAESDAYENGDGSPKYDQRSAAEYHVAEKNWLAAESNYKKQQAVISQAQVAVQAASLAYQATQNAVVKASADGAVSNLSVAPGRTVTVSAPTAPTTPLATITTPGATEIVVSLSENDIAKVAEGQRVSVDISSVDNKKYNGIVRRVDSVGTNASGVTRFNIYIEVVDPDQNLRPGMTADVEIATKELHDVLTVPSAAVKPYKGGRAVRVIDPKTKRPVFRPVRIGVKGESTTEILSGIADGTEVVTALSNEQLKRSGGFF